LKLNRNQLWWMMWLLTEHSHLKEHIFRLELTITPTCERCLEKDELTTNVLCDVEAVAYLGFCYLRHCFMEPGDYQVPFKWDFTSPEV
jgi:hypothetical protein